MDGGALINSSSSKEREERSVALEKAYVHDVYQQIAWQRISCRARPKVKQFLLDLEPGSVICDVGCGNGKYLNFNPSVFKIGLDNCSNVTKVAREKEHEIILSDNLALPFRDECFDAVLSIAVIHHFATTERRVAALKELARILKIGGRLMLSVWSMEQRHRKWSSSSQDVLVPWTRPLTSNSENSSIERDLNSTTTTGSGSGDDATHYNVFTQTSDSDSFQHTFSTRKRRQRSKGRSIDPTCPSTSSSSDVSSPNESCYSFVRRALQKIAGTKRNRGGRRPWFFLQGFDHHQTDPALHHFGSLEGDVGLEFRHVNNVNNSPAVPEQLMPIELRLESTEFSELLDNDNLSKKKRPSGFLLSNVQYPRRNTSPIAPNPSPLESQQPKSKSLSSLIGLLRSSTRRSTDDFKRGQPSLLLEHQESEVVRSQSSLSGLISANLEQDFMESGSECRHKAVQTDGMDGSGSNSGSTTALHTTTTTSATESGNNAASSVFTHFQKMDSLSSTTIQKLRPTLVKQKQSICSNTTASSTSADGKSATNDEDNEQHKPRCSDASCGENNKELLEGWGDIKQSIKDLPEFKQTPPRAPSASSSSSLHKSSTCSHSCQQQQQQQNSSARASALEAGSSFWKQTSLNEELIFSERLKEKERLKQHIQKQCSLNEDLMYKHRENNNTRWDQMKEAFLNSSNSVKCLQLLKAGLSTRFRGSTTSASTATGDHHPHHGSNTETIGNNCGSAGVKFNSNSMTTTINMNSCSSGTSSNYVNSSIPPNQQKPPVQNSSSSSSSSMQHFLKMLQNWKQGDEPSYSANPGASGIGGNNNNNNNNSIGSNSSNSSFAASSLGGAGSGGTSNTFLNVRRGSKEGAPRRGLFVPFPPLFRRSSAGSLTLSSKKEFPSEAGGNMPIHHQVLSPPYTPPYNDPLAGGNGNNKLLPGVRHVRKLSREDGSDSSKDSSSSFQSDTSVDSEDSSFASVIFIPKTGEGGVDPLCFNSDSRRTDSTDSDRSPKSPASRSSPPNHNVPKSPSPLASEIIMRRKSPEVSPTRINLYGNPSFLEATKFVFDEPTTTFNLKPLQHHHHAHEASSGNSNSSASNNNNNTNTNASCGSTNVKDELLSASTSSLPSVALEMKKDGALTALEEADEEDLSLDKNTNDTRINTENKISSSVPVPTNKTNIDSSSTKKHSKSDKIEVLRKPANLPSCITRQLVRRSLPKALAAELFNPETDDADTSDNSDTSSSSSSPNSVSSVVSVPEQQLPRETSSNNSSSGHNKILENVPESPQEEELQQLDVIPLVFPLSSETNKDKDSCSSSSQHLMLLPSISEDSSTSSSTTDHHHPPHHRERERRKSSLSSSSLLEAATHVVTSFENLVTQQTSPKTRRNVSMLTTRQTSEWLSSLPAASSSSCEISSSQSSISSSSSSSRRQLSALPRGRNPGEKIIKGEVKRRELNLISRDRQAQPDAKWPSMAIDGSPPQIPKLNGDDDLSPRNSLHQQQSTAGGGPADGNASGSGHLLTGQSSLSTELGGEEKELEEKDSLYDSTENLTNNPSMDSSVRMSSTCSCSIRGGDSFESWTSAKSSLTNSSFPPSLPSNHKPASINIPGGSGGRSGKRGGGGTGAGSTGLGASKSSAAGEGEESTALTYHRYYHVFREGELDKLIEKYVQNLHIISSYYDHKNWCVICERVQMWTI